MVGWSESVEPRFKVHLLDEGYVWVPTTHNFVEDFVFGEKKLDSKIYEARLVVSRRAKT